MSQNAKGKLAKCLQSLAFLLEPQAADVRINWSACVADTFPAGLPGPMLEAVMITSHSQRWRDGRTIFVRGEAFDPASYSVRAIGEQDARAFVVDHHYSKSFPAARHSVGLFRRGGAQAERLTGVAVFSVPMNQAVVPRYTGLMAEAGAELGRFVLLDEAPMPAESWFLSRAFGSLRAAKPKIEAVVSYADPATWRSPDGAITKPGHIGKAYWALCARDHGRTEPRKRWLAGEGGGG